MPELASIFSGVQVGPEVTPGSSVAASKLLNYMELAPGIDLTFNTFRPMGQLVPSAITPGADDTSWAISGAGSYSEIVYALCSLLTNVTPTTVDTSARLWDFIPLLRSEDTVKTYTVESGSNTRAQKATYSIFNGLEITFNKSDGVTLSGDAFGQAIQDNITLTPTPTAVEDKPIFPNHLDVYLDNTSAGLGTTKLLRDFNAVFRCTDRWGKVRPINSTQSSFTAHVNTEPTVEMEIRVAADSPGMAILADARATNAIRYLRMAAVAPSSYGFAGAVSAPYQLLIDMAGKVSSVNNFGDDEDGVKVVNYTFTAVGDAAWGTGRYLRIQAQNKVTAL